MTKAELRKIFLVKQRSLSADERELKSSGIRDLFFETLDLSSVRYLHCFIPIPRFNEINTRLIFERLWKDHPRIQTLVPRVSSKTGEMQNLRFAPETQLIESAWNIHEPVHQDQVETSRIDIVLVPLLCFDRQGHRVGYGKGFYDRFLAACRTDCVKVGLSYFPPVDVIEDVNSFDVTLDRCVTPGEIFTMGKI